MAPHVPTGGLLIQAQMAAIAESLLRTLQREGDPASQSHMTCDLITLQPMTETRAALLVRCFEQMRSGVPEAVHAADEQLRSALETPGVVGDLMNIALTHADEAVRYYAIVLLEKSIFRPGASYNAEELAQIRAAVVRLLQQETRDQNLCYAFSIAADCAKEYKESGGFGELVQVLGELMKREEKIPLCLAAWDMLVSIDSFTGEMLGSVIGALVEVIVKCLQHEERMFRSRAVALLLSIVMSGHANGVFKAFPALLEAVVRCVQIALEQGDEVEVLKVFEFVSLLMISTEEEIETIYPALYDIVKRVVANSDISPITRQNVLLFCAALSDVNPGVMADDMEGIIDATIQALYVQCKMDPEEFDPTNGDTFLVAIAFVEDWSERLLQKIMEYAKANGSDSVALRIALACLSYICEPCAELFEDHIPEITQFIGASMAVDDVFVYSELCKLLQRLSEFVPACLTDMSALIGSMLDRYKHPDSLPSLDVILTNAVDPIPNEMEVIKRLVSILNSDNAEEVISCITGVLSNSNTVNEELYGAVRAVLSQLLQTDVAHTSVFECFSHCFKIAPQTVRADIPLICNAMLADLSKNPDPSALGMIASAVGSLALVLPITMSEFMPKFFDIFATILEQTAEDGEGVATDERVNDTMKGNLLRCMASIFSSNPQGFQAKFTPIMTIVTDWLSRDDEFFVSMAVKVLENLNRGLRLIQFSMDEIVGRVVGHIEQIDDENLSEDLLVLLGAILEENSGAISDATVQRLGAFFVDCLSLRVVSLCKSNAIDTRFAAPLGYAMTGYILGGSFVRCPDNGKFVQALVNHALGKRKQMQSYALTSLARICFVAPANMNEIAPRVLTGAMQMLNRPRGVTDAVKNSMFAALMYLLSSHRALFTNDQLVLILNGCEQCWAGENASLKDTTILVWLMLVTLCDVPDSGKLANVLRMLPLGVDDEGMPIYTQCLSVIQTRNPELISDRLVELVPVIFATTKTYTQRIPADQYRQWATVVTQFSQEQLLAALKYNESYMLELQRNVQ